MIVLKNLAREFDMDPYDVRAELRKKFKPRNRRWKWDDKDPQLVKVRCHLQSLQNTTPTPNASETVISSAVKQPSKISGKEASGRKR